MSASSGLEMRSGCVKEKVGQMNSALLVPRMYVPVSALKNGRNELREAS